MRKFILVAPATVATLAVPAVASADAPDGTWTIDPKASADASAIGKQSSQITQNGQWVSGKYTGLDGWQDQRADRAAPVQDQPSVTRSSNNSRHGRAGFGWPVCRSGGGLRPMRPGRHRPPGPAVLIGADWTTTPTTISKGHPLTFIRIAGALAVASLIYLVLAVAGSEAHSTGSADVGVFFLLAAVIAPIWFSVWRIRRIVREARAAKASA